MKIGILDFGGIYGSKQYSHHILNDLVTRVPLAEELGFHRYWLGEHYGGSAWGNPEILVGLLLGITEEIKIGPAGILLQLHSPFRVAQNFQLLNLYFSDRVDLGIARAVSNSIYDQAVLDVVQQDFSKDNYRRKFRELVHCLDDSFPKEHPYAAMNVNPTGIERPNIWVLGSSNSQIAMAVEHRAQFCLSHFYHSETTPLAPWIKTYQATFEERHQERPESSIAITCLIAENEQRVEQVKAQVLRKDLPLKGVKINLIATRKEIKEKLLTLQDQLQVEQIVLLNVSKTNEDQVESMHIVSEELGLKLESNQD